ncbi:hypothetical protein F5Y19DRAFT_437393 [Xylariaceae sp. FL1651]|nr:hypothetical protein F5Y19DRAFT_437393 [Xylariaceae sp. FL1651]
MVSSLGTSSMNAGYQLECAMWALTALSLTLVALRLYTRIYVVKFIGAEDYMYAGTGVFLLLFTVFIQISVHYGLGRNFWILSLDDSSHAIFWTYVANTFAILGNAMAKLSMGLFLLRVVQVRWHKIALWAAVAATVITSIVLATLLWNQSTPRKASWDPLRTPGKWNVQIQPLSVGLGVWSSICDFFFAAFPWLFIWSLPNISRREKIFLSSGMSLGVIAGVCGIIRTVVLARLNFFDYTLNFVPYFAWAGAEIAVALVCTGIPTLRPLYIKFRGLANTYENHSWKRNSGHLPRFAMCERKGISPSPTRDLVVSHLKRDHSITQPLPTYVNKNIRRDSVEELISGYHDRNRAVIWVKNEIRVRESVAEWPLKN